MIFFSINKYEPNSEALSNVDYIITLGAKVESNHEPSLWLKSRLDLTIKYANLTTVPIIVSGGKGDDEPISEAKCMEQYLIANNIDKHRIIKEEKATSTFENLKYSKQIIEDISSKDKTVLFISNDFHSFRISLLANRLDFNYYISTTKSTHSVKNMIREPLAILKSIILDR